MPSRVKRGFAVLLLLGTFVDFQVGRMLGFEVVEKRRKLLLWISVGVNLALLGFFKYYDFFIESFVDLLGLFGVNAGVDTWDTDASGNKLLHLQEAFIHH